MTRIEKLAAVNELFLAPWPTNKAGIQQHIIDWDSQLSFSQTVKDLIDTLDPTITYNQPTALCEDLGPVSDFDFPN